MNISRLEAKNIKGFSDFEFNPGAVTVVSGHNASNKTSFLALVTGLCGKGNPRMLRAGTESGHIRAILEGEGETLEVRREFVPGKVKTPSVKSSKAGKLGAGVEYLASLMDPISVDPINRAMNASEEEQTRILLDTMPMKLDGPALATAVAPLSSLKLPNLPAILKSTAGMNGMDAAKAVEDYVYEQRTLVNRDEKLKRAHASEMMAAIPPGGDGEDWAANATNAESGLQQLREDEQAEVRAEDGFLASEREKANEEYRTAKDIIDAEINKQIQELEKQRAESKATISEMLSGRLELSAENSGKRLAAISLKYRPRREALAAAKAEATTRAQDATRISEVKRIAADASSQSDALKEKSALLTSALKAIDDVRGAMLENLPIKGLVVQGGVIYLDGVPLSEKNTAERALFWMRIAMMRAGELGIICADGCECLDDETFAKLLDGMRRSGVQWFIARVTSGDFKVETFEALE